MSLSCVYLHTNTVCRYTIYYISIHCNVFAIVKLLSCSNCIRICGGISELLFKIVEVLAGL